MKKIISKIFVSNDGKFENKKYAYYGINVIPSFLLYLLCVLHEYAVLFSL